MDSNKRDNLSKDELIQKLQKISKLCDNVLKIKNEIDNVNPQDDYPRRVSVPVFPGKYEDEDEREELENTVDHTDDDAIDQMGNAYDDMYHPKKPADPKTPTYMGADTKKSQEKQRNHNLFKDVGNRQNVYNFSMERNYYKLQVKALLGKL